MTENQVTLRKKKEKSDECCSRLLNDTDIWGYNRSLITFCILNVLDKRKRLLLVVWYLCEEDYVSKFVELSLGSMKRP